MGRVTRVLFICSRNRWRSPTAETLFAEWPGVETASAGVSRDAEQPVTADLLDWADLILVMEPKHRRKLTTQFGSVLRGKRLGCLSIPDDYEFMDPKLVKLLQQRVPSFFDGTA